QDALGLAPAPGVDGVPEVGVVALRRELHGALAELAPALVRGELLLPRRRADVTPEEPDVREHDHGLDVALTAKRVLEVVARASGRAVAGEEVEEVLAS